MKRLVAVLGMALVAVLMTASGANAWDCAPGTHDSPTPPWGCVPDTPVTTPVPPPTVPTSETPAPAPAPAQPVPAAPAPAPQPAPAPTPPSVTPHPAPGPEAPDERVPSCGDTTTCPKPKPTPVKTPTATPTVTPAHVEANSLPYTGIDTGMVALLGAMCLGGGLVLRRKLAK